MSFLFKPITGGGAGITGTAVDPANPFGGTSGVLIDPTLEMTQPGGPYGPGFHLETDGFGAWVIVPTGASDNTFVVQFTHDAGVPSFGTRYLRFGEGVHSSQAGFRMPLAGRLRGITVQVNTIDASNAYDVEVLVDPAGRLGAPTVLATLPLATSTLFNTDRTLAAAVATTDELGVRIVRTAGAGVSAFVSVIVATEWSIP